MSKQGHVTGRRSIDLLIDKDSVQLTLTNVTEKNFGRKFVGQSDSKDQIYILTFMFFPNLYIFLTFVECRRNILKNVSLFLSVKLKLVGFSINLDPSGFYCKIYSASLLVF